MDHTQQHDDWRKAPRKADEEKYSHTAFVRMTEDQKECLRILASRRGETESQFIRDLVVRETHRVIDSQADAEFPVPPGKAKIILALIKGISRGKLTWPLSAPNLVLDPDPVPDPE